MSVLDETTLLVSFRALQNPSTAALFTAGFVLGLLLLAKV